MGAWGSGNFENDGVLDFIVMLEHEGFELVEEAFDAILDLDDYIDVDYSYDAIGAGEVVAMLKGKPSKDIPDNLTEWHKSHRLSVGIALTTKAILAVEKSFANNGECELRELWQGSPDFQTVESNINDLLSRLR